MWPSLLCSSADSRSLCVNSFSTTLRVLCIFSLPATRSRTPHTGQKSNSISMNIRRRRKKSTKQTRKQQIGEREREKKELWCGSVSGGVRREVRFHLLSLQVYANDQVSREMLEKRRKPIRAEIHVAATLWIKHFPKSFASVSCIRLFKKPNDDFFLKGRQKLKRVDWVKCLWLLSVSGWVFI